MFYRIAGITLRSSLKIPSFNAFVCEPRDPDTVLEITDEFPPEGSEIAILAVVCRRVPDGWFFHDKADSKVGLLVNNDYSHMRMIRQGHSPITFHEKLFVRIALECLLARQGYVSLHAACISLNDEAIAFTGDSGIGKSTRAAIWQDIFQASLISGDRPLIHVEKQEVYGVPWDGKEHCFRSVHYPLKAICEVRRADSVYIRKLSLTQKRRLLTRQCFIPMWDTDTTAIQMVNISRLASSANIIRIFCGPAEEDAKTLRQILDLNQQSEERLDLKAKKGFILRNIMDDYMLIPIDDNINHFNGTLLMNETSSFIWEKLQNPVSREDLLIALMDQYKVDEEKALADLDNLLGKLRSYDIIDED